MVQSPSWAANWFADSQEIPRISRNPKVHYRTHKRPPPVSILGQPNPVHIPTSHLMEIRPNIIHPSTLRSPQWSLSLQFSHQHPMHPRRLTHMRHMPLKCLNQELNSETNEFKLVVGFHGCKNARYETLSTFLSWVELESEIFIVLALQNSFCSTSR